MLTGFLIADFSRILAGPLCTMLLADAGARVIKVEDPRGGDETRRWGPPFLNGVSAYFLSVNRGKESVAVDLKTEAGRAIAAKLIARADVVIHNFREAQARAFALTADDVRKINPRAVHCVIRGYDREAPEPDLPGYDLLAQAAGGLMAITGPRDGEPSKVGVAVSDVLTAHYANGAILAALLERERKGVVRSIEIPLMSATVASLVNVAQNFLVTGREPARHGNEHASIVPYQAFRASDRTFVLAVATDRHFGLLCREIIGMAELCEDERFRTNEARVTNRRELLPILEGELAQHPAAHWIRLCAERGIPAALVQSFEEIFAREASMLVTTREHAAAGEVRLVGSPVRFDGVFTTAKAAPPGLGEHTERVLAELDRPA